MSEFSPSDAALEGFQVLRRHWRVVVGWAGFNLIGLVTMVLVAVVGIFLAVAVVSATGGGDEAASGAGGLIGGGVGFLGALFIEVAVVAALFRMLLRGGPPEFFYLRFGPDEARLLGVWLTVLAIAGALAFGFVGLAVLAAPAGGWAGVAITIAGLAAAAWILTRLCLAAPLSFAERRFGLAAAWRLSRGRFWSLLGMNVLALCLLAVVAVAAWLALFLLTAAISGFRDFGVMSLSSRDALLDHPGRYLLQLGIEMVVGPVLWVISQAPLVAAYQALTGPQADPSEA